MSTHEQNAEKKIETARQMAASAADPSLAEQAFQDVLAAKKGVRGYTP